MTSLGAFKYLLGIQKALYIASYYQKREPTGHWELVNSPYKLRTDGNAVLK